MLAAWDCGTEMHWYKNIHETQLITLRSAWHAIILFSAQQKRSQQCVLCTAVPPFVYYCYSRF